VSSGPLIKHDHKKKSSSETGPAVNMESSDSDAVNCLYCRIEREWRGLVEGDEGE